MTTGNKTPYQVRQELFETAKDLLIQNWYANRQVIQNNWDTTIEIAKLTGEATTKMIKDAPALPAMPTIEEMVAMANKINEFVSNDKKSK